ncbi:zinc-binding dehydrogenase [Candidatus Bathyarchaeota archaeon]|nr:zinc-binding dehydrogenase [Candidatus Bathyarchaeota archaeon]
MKAARFYGVGQPLRIEEVEKPEVSSREVLVKIRACGICHTDLHFIDEGLLKPGRIPQIMGHEAAGDIVEVGGEVESVREGDRVLIHFYFSCGECYYCLRGRESLCISPDFRQFGFNTDGGYAEYAKAPARSVLEMPDGVPYESGILVDAGSTAYHAVRRIGGVSLGDTAVIVGAGGVGLCTLQIAKLSGATVIAVDIRDDKLRLAESLGADYTVNSAKKDLVTEVKELTNGRGVDFVYELVGQGKTMRDSMSILARGGKLVFIGYSEDNLTLDPRRTIREELQVVGSRASSKFETMEVVRLVSEGKFKLEPLISHRIPLEKVNDGLDLVRRGEAIRAVVMV